MLRSSALIRHLARLAVLLPLAAPFAACSDGGSDTAGDAGAGGDGASGGDALAQDGGPLGDGALGDGALGDADAVAPPDTTPPTVVLTNPSDNATGASTNASIDATFSEQMDALTITSATFGLKQGATVIDGTVTYFNGMATFNPTADLALNTTYTATITTGAKDLAGNAMVAPYTWKFTTNATAPIGPAPVKLGAAGNYVILAESKIANVPTSAITGDVALSPAAATYITGFSLTKAGTRWTSPQVTGSVFAADNDPPTPINLTTAVTNMMTAYTDAAGRPNPVLNLGSGGAIGGLTFVPGLYKWTSTVTIPTDITLSGAANDTWIFQVTGDLKMSAATKMKLISGARAKNIVWQVAGLVDFGTTSHAEGIVLSKTAITLETGASISGRLLAQTAVNVAGVAVTSPAP
jgi:hypothetical protein